MRPVSPVFIGLEQFEVVLSKDSPDFAPLPVLVGSRPFPSLVTRWLMTDEERAQIVAGADVYVRTIGPMTPPLMLFVATPHQPAGEIPALMDMLGIGEILPNENVDDVLSNLSSLTDERL